jgi:hypothetical protein
MSITDHDVAGTTGAAPPTDDTTATAAPAHRSAWGTLGVLIVPATWVLAWVLALAGVQPSGYHAGQGFSVDALRWMLYLPAGWMFLVSGLMHTKYAHRTAALIGWQTNGFQYELGFVSFGGGLAGIYASLHGAQAWVAVSISITVFLVAAGVNHVIDMVRNRNFQPGNTFICISDFGLPISLWALLFTAHAV